jgi:hypothetical protein
MSRALTTFVGLAATIVFASPLDAAQSRPDLKARTAFASDASGAPISPMAGDEFFVTLDYDVVDQITGTYKVVLDAKYAKMETPALNLGVGAPGSYRVTWGPIIALTNDPVLVKATLVKVKSLREVSTRNNMASFTLTTIRPDGALERYSPRLLDSEMGLELVFDPNRLPENLMIAVPRVQETSFQSLLWQGNTDQFDQLGETAAGWTGTTVLFSGQAQLTWNQRTTAFAQRVNPEMLSASTGEIPASELKWLGDEVFAPSNDAKIRQFALSATRSSTTPYERAKAIFKSVVKTIRYDHIDGNWPSATDALRKKKADCGGMSSLFVAACRSIGIPARAMVGFTEGTSQWHVWAEFYVAGAGWVACDPAYSDAKNSDGSLALYFGVMPDLNRRVATSVGFDVELPDRTLPLLQAPSAFWTNSNARLVRAASYSRLAVAQSP